tara:strand:+ start:37522 stop:38760 length:1239 start_codon:yes stop_codon:yes gene_type:complete
MDPRTFFVYLDEKRLVQSFRSGLDLGTPVFYAGDTEPVRFIFLRKSTLGRPYDVVDPPSTLKVGIGNIAAPGGGTWIADYNGDQTASLAYNISAADLSTALNALSSVTSAGGLAVSGGDGGPWKIIWNNAGARVDFTFDTSKLTPESHAIFGETTVGDGSTASVSTIRLAELPAVFNETWSSLSAPAITVTEQTAGDTGSNEIQRISIDPLPYDGSFYLTYDGGETSAAIPYNATAAEVTSILESVSTIGAGNVSVAKIGAGAWDVQYIGDLAETNISLMTANAGSLVGYVGLAGVLSLDTPRVAALLANLSEQTLTFELEATESSNRRTQIQRPALVKNDLIAGQPLSPPNFARSYSQAETDALFMSRTPVDVPTSSTASGTRGDWAEDGTYLYLCIDTDTWLKIPAINSF